MAQSTPVRSMHLGMLEVRLLHKWGSYGSAQGTRPDLLQPAVIEVHIMS